MSIEKAEKSKGRSSMEDVLGEISPNKTKVENSAENGDESGLFDVKKAAGVVSAEQYNELQKQVSANEEKFESFKGAVVKTVRQLQENHEAERAEDQKRIEALKKELENSKNFANMGKDVGAGDISENQETREAKEIAKVTADIFGVSAEAITR